MAPEEKDQSPVNPLHGPDNDDVSGDGQWKAPDPGFHCNSHDESVGDAVVSNVEPVERGKIFGITTELFNILVLGFGFMFSIGAYQTTAMAQVSLTDVT